MWACRSLITIGPPTTDGVNSHRFIIKYWQFSPLWLTSKVAIEVGGIGQLQECALIARVFWMGVKCSISSGATDILCSVFRISQRCRGRHPCSDRHAQFQVTRGWLWFHHAQDEEIMLSWLHIPTKIKYMCLERTNRLVLPTPPCDSISPPVSETTPFYRPHFATSKFARSRPFVARVCPSRVVCTPGTLRHDSCASTTTRQSSPWAQAHRSCFIPSYIPGIPRDATRPSVVQSA